MWPQLSNINGAIASKIKNRNNVYSSKLNSWVRVFSGANNGLILQSSPDYSIFTKTNSNGSIYGDSKSSGTIGYDWHGKAVNTGGGRTLRPRPIITALEVKEGHDQISRQATLHIKCYTLEQLELIQTYFMEPGYSLCIEFGWNTANAASGVIRTDSQSTILNDCTSINLNQDALHNLRILTHGDYDSFLGFIVGGNISAEGETFDIQVDLRGAPSLPTYLQSHNLPLEQKGVGGNLDSVKNNRAPHPYPASELEEKNGDDAARKRRFKSMFNELPSFRQTDDIKTLLDKTKSEDFINFDKVIAKTITTYAGPPGNTDSKYQIIEAANIPIQKEKFFSKNRYISFGLAVNILNTNGVFDGYSVGSKTVSMKIDIDNTVIGAFPKIFSTKADKLIISGVIPDFTVFFLNKDGIDADKLLNSKIDATDAGNAFVQQTELKPSVIKGFAEDSGYWGYLKNLYVNFDMFKNKIEQKNKNIREVLLDILNEMASAVNSFWNFQIVEKKQDNGDIVLTVIDEHWIGKNPTSEPIQTFYHNGNNSTFIESNLELSIPAEMTNQIVSRRLALVTNPDTPISDVGGFFNAKKDLFLDAVVLNGSKRPTQEEADNNEQKKPPPSSDPYDALIGVTSEDIDTGNSTGSTRIYKRNGKEIGSVYIGSTGDIQSASGEGNSIYNLKKTQSDQQAAEQKVKEDLYKANLTQNLDKIDIVPNPSLYSMGDITDTIMETSDQFKQKFVIYCLNDTNFFDKLKNIAFYQQKPKSAEPKQTPNTANKTNSKQNEKPDVKADGSDSHSNKRLSHPLPIKYTFKILGISGLRRGDMFNIIGIPAKYAKYGLFQVTEIEHSIEGMKWTTQVKGEYRQVQ